MPREALDVRRRLFQSELFWEQASDRLSLEGDLIRRPLVALLESGLLPCDLAHNARALAADAAMILLAVGSRQSAPNSIVRVTKRLGTMNQQCEIGGRDPARGIADIFPRDTSLTFGTDLSDLFCNLWRAARQSTTSGFAGVTVSMLWADERGSVLFGEIDQPGTGRKRVFSNEPLHIPSTPDVAWKFVQLPTVGGIVFSATSILRFAALLAASVANTRASLDLAPW